MCIDVLGLAASMSRQRLNVAQIGALLQPMHGFCLYPAFSLLALNTLRMLSNVYWSIVCPKGIDSLGRYTCNKP